ncbi:trichohyalin-like isoform X2 [Eriocheir sinensis]|uniref:trichohyalin-like isoform X2 n=1 Tax=Eriocheir sinensis TaxID=95602 RepID=UPI0021CA4EE2|nr:trichohyalin-like isoform X2 [Eriocheir sinensis]
MAYTSIEKLKILAYIHKEKLHDKVNGNIIWKKMEEEEVCPGRTWQSMKEHFRKSLSHQLDKFPKHLSDVFSHPPKQHGFYKKPAPPLPEQQSSSSSDRNIDMDNAPMDERDDRVKCTKASDGCGRSFAQRITRDERTSGSTEEGTHKSSSHVSKQKKMKESIKGGNYFVPLSAQTDERRENENQNTQVTIPAPEQVRAEGGRESNMEGADQTTQTNNQETTPAPQQVRTEGGRERGIREGADQTSQVCTQKENHSDSVKECRHFILPSVLTEEKEESENSSSPVNVPVPERDRTEEEGRGKQESRDDNDNTPSYMLHSDTEDMDIELLLNECKKTEHSKSHLNTGSEEVNVCETKEGELDRVSPSILTSSDAFFMDMHSVLQESQGFSVYHLDPLSGEKEKEDMRSGKNSKEKYFRDEQQEPDSSIQILEEPEGWSKSDKRAQSQLLKSSKSGTNQMDSFSTLSTQNDQETLLAKDNEDDLLLEEIFQTSEYLTSSIPDCAHSALNAKATMEELYKAVEPLPGPSDTISSSQDFICSTNIFQHDKSAAPLSRPTLPQEGNEVNKESKERKEDTEESQGKETGGMMEDCVRSATNDKATQEELQKASHPLSISMKKKQGQKKEQKNQDHGPDNEDREKQDEEIRKIQEVKELEVEAAEEEEEAVIVGKNGEELDDVGKVDEKDENEEEEKVNKESEDKDDEKETEEIPVNEVSNSSKHSTSSLIQDCEISAINDKAIHGEFQMAVHPSSILSRERQGQEEEPEYQDQALENEDGEQGEEQEMEEGESAEDEEGEVVVEDRRVVKEFNDDEEEEQEVEKVSRGIEERKHEEEEDEFSDNDISDFSKRSTSSMIQDAGRSAVSDEANLEEYQESVHPLSPLAKKKQEQEKKQENQEQKLDNEDGREQVEEMEEVLEVEAAEEEEEIVEERTDEGGLNDYDNEEEEEEEEDEVEVGRGNEERKDEEEENKIADSEISDCSRHSASSMIQEHVKSAVKGKTIQRDLQQAAPPSSASVRRRQEQEKEQGNQEFEYEDGEEQGEEILLDKEMEETLEVEGAIEEDAIVTEDEEESNNDAEVEEERHDEEEFEIRKRNQEKSKQRPLYFSSRLPMKRRRMELCHTSSHITNDGPSTSQAEPRQHTQEEPALSYLRAPPGSRSYSSRSLTCSWKSTDHSTPQRQKAGSYTVMEDLAIINYIVKENAYDRVGGRALWQEMATNFPTDRREGVSRGEECGGASPYPDNNGEGQATCSFVLQPN